MASVYGVRFAPGVNVEITAAAKPPSPGDVGTTVIYGVFQRGPVGAPGEPPVAHNNRLTLDRRRGGYVENYFGIDGCRHWIEAAQGAGKLYSVRVTDGSETNAEMNLYGRQPPMGVLFRQSDPAFNPIALAVSASPSPGRAAGKRKVTGGTLAALGSVTETTVTTGQTMLVDEYAGGTLRLEGVASTTYTIVSNTAAGVITVESDSTMLTDLNAGTPTTLEWSAEIVNLEADGTRKGFALRVVPRGQKKPSSDFGVKCKVDGAQVWALADLAMVDLFGRNEVDTTINEKADNYEIRTVKAWTGGDNPLARPANWAGIIEEDGLGATQMQLRIVEWRKTNGTGDGYVDTFLYGDDVRADTLTLTFTGATTYTVASTLVEDIPAALALGANDLHLLHPFLSGFTVTAGAVPFVSGDVITIVVKPLPQDGSMRGALVYPDGAGTNAGTGVPVLSNTHDTITVPTSYDLTTLASEPEHAYLQTTVGPWDTDTGSAGGFTITGIDDELGTGIADFTVPGSLALTATQLVAAWEAHDDRLWGEVQTDGSAYLGVQSTGLLAYFEITGGTAVGAGPSVFDAVGTDYGADGSLVLVEYDQELGEGYDGIASLADSDMVSAMDQYGSIASLLNDNTGGFNYGAPGWTGTTVVAAGQQLGQDTLGIFVPDFPQSKTTEESAKDYVEGTWGESDYYAPFWPSWGYIDRPETGEKNVLTPLSGKVLGLQAYSWATFGMGKPPAGIGLQITGVNKFLKANDKADADAEQLNMAGIRTLTKYGTTLPVLWGDRMPGVTRVWFHKAALAYQLGKEFLYPGNFARFIFEINDALTWADIKTAARTLMEAHYATGWFRRDVTFDTAVSVRIDSDTTPEATRALGIAVLAVGYMPTDALEQLQIKVSEQGVEV